jgi:hypothetical protein
MDLLVQWRCVGRARPTQLVTNEYRQTTKSGCGSILFSSEFVPLVKPHEAMTDWQTPQLSDCATSRRGSYQ